MNLSKFLILLLVKNTQKISLLCYNLHLFITLFAQRKTLCIALCPTTHADISSNFSDGVITFSQQLRYPNIILPTSTLSLGTVIIKPQAPFYHLKTANSL